MESHNFFQLMNHKNNQNPYYLKELDNLKQQMTKLQHTVINNVIMQAVEDIIAIVKFITGLNSPKTTGLLLEQS